MAVATIPTIPGPNALPALAKKLRYAVAGNLVSGYLSDLLFKRISSGRAILGTVVVFLSAILIFLTMYTTSVDRFYVLGVITAFVLPMAGPSVNAGVMDIIEPELRGSATAYLNFFASAGSAFD